MERLLYRKDKNESVLTGPVPPTYLSLLLLPLLLGHFGDSVEQFKTITLAETTEHKTYFTIISQNYNLSTHEFYELKKQNINVALLTE